MKYAKFLVGGRHSLNDSSFGSRVDVHNALPLLNFNLLF